MQGSTILHVIDTTGPGGAETIFLEIAQHLVLPGYRNFAVIKGSGWVENQLKRRGIPYCIVKPSGLFSIPYYWKLYKLIRQEKVALVHAHLLGSTLTYSILTILARLPLIATLHGRVDINPKERFVGIKQRIMRMGVDQLIAVSRDLASYIQKRGLFPIGSIDVIYNGVDETLYKRSSSEGIRKQFNIPSNAKLVGSLGNVRPAKDYETLVSAIALLNLEEVHFVVAGHQKQDLMESLSRKMRELDVEKRVHFIGFYEDTPDFLAQLDLFVLSSSTEGFSIAIIEAMAAGLPIVSTRCGGPEEILEHLKTGIFVAVRNPKELSLRIGELLKNEVLAKDLSKSARVHVGNHFSLSAMLEQYSKQYRKFVSVS